jgi:hypothetical protein
MIWVSWRQHRDELLGLAGVMALLAVIFVPVGLQMRHVFAHTGMAGCVPDGFSSSTCSDAFASFQRQFDWFTSLLGWLNLVPGILGAAVGAPLVAREMERGTFRLAFTQSVSRTRWILVKVAVLAVAVISVAMIFIVLVTWTRVPLDRLGSRLNPNTTFDFEGTVGVGYFLFAFALGAFLGTVLRRVVPALVGTLILFVPVRLIVQSRRLSFFPPLTRTANASILVQQKVGSDYVLGISLGADPHRYPTASEQMHALSQATVACPLQKSPDPACLQVHGVRAIETYVPLSRFWELQLIETSGFVLTAAVLLGLTVWIVRRRRS